MMLIVRAIRGLGHFWLKGALLAFGWWISAVVFWGGASLVSSQFSFDGLLYDPIMDVADRIIPIATWMRSGTRLLLVVMLPLQFALFYYWFVRPLSATFRVREED